MSKTQLRVSVVIPVYNEGKYIGACLESLMRQTVPADEIIVVDNNSTDDTVKIAKQYPVKIIKETKQGRGHARNRGFNKAQYDIIARTDGDSILPSNWIKRIKKKFTDEKIVAISGPAEFYDLPEFIQNTHWQTKTTWIKVINTYNKVVRQLLKHDSLYGPNCALRKSAWNQIKNTTCLDDNQVHEDLDLAIHLAPLGTIKFYPNLKVSTSVRRWKKPEAYVEYLFRGLKSIRKHKQIGTRKQSKLLMQKLVSKTLSFDRRRLSLWTREDSNL